MCVYAGARKIGKKMNATILPRGYKIYVFLIAVLHVWKGDVLDVYLSQI